MKAYPRRFLSLLVVSFIVLLVSGLLLVPTVLDLRFGFDVVWRLGGGQSNWVAGIHSATALLVCGFTGALWSIHMRAGWHSRRHRLSGPASFAGLIGAALAALGVLYFGEPSWLTVASAAHTLLALAAVIGAAIHWRLAVLARGCSSEGRSQARRAAAASTSLGEAQSSAGRP